MIVEGYVAMGVAREEVELLAVSLEEVVDAELASSAG